MKKLKITYKMAKGNETAEKYIELPCEDAHYALAKENRGCVLIPQIIFDLIRMQGYQSLVNISIDFDEED